MNTKMLLLLCLIAGLTACSSDDDDYTELWTVNIEPEFVLDGDYWGGYTYIHPVMEATDDAGNRTGTYSFGQIEGFDFEEGYRYKLQIEAEDVLKPYEDKHIYIADASRYKFTLKKVLSKEYVGIREEGRRDLEMDVQTMRIRSTYEADSWEYSLLVGHVVGTDEFIPMGRAEIKGLDNHWELFKEWQDDGTVTGYYKVRMRVSITPSDKPVYRDVYRRIRLQEIVSREEIENDSIIYKDKNEIENLLYFGY